MKIMDITVKSIKIALQEKKKKYESDNQECYLLVYPALSL